MNEKDIETMNKKSFHDRLDEFVVWMENDGTFVRWKKKKVLADLKRNRRKLNKKIRETAVIIKVIKEMEETA